MNGRRIPLARKASADSDLQAEGSAGTDFAALREEMVEAQITRRGIKDPRVIAAMGRVPRHEFVPEAMRAHAYEDRPLPIGHDQTISQPYIVAFMTEALRLPEKARVLEIGTGSGYQTAVLAEIAAEVCTVEIVPELAERAAARLTRGNVVFAQRDGAGGWPEKAPFDGILVAAGASQVPSAWQEQLAPGGRLIMPLGGREWQHLVVVTREQHRFLQEKLLIVCFVPLTGRAVAGPGAPAEF